MTAALWPARLRQAHTFATWSLLPLVLSGLVLYVPALHTRWIRYLPAVLDLHVGLGLVFVAALLSPVAVSLRRRVVWAEWGAAVALGLATCVTGILLWMIGWFPAGWRAAAGTFHLPLAGALLLWTGWHAARHLRAPRGILLERWRQQPSRREFLRLAVGWAAGSFFGAGLWAWFSAGADTAVSEGVDDGHRGFQFYTVTGKFPTYDAATYRLALDGLFARPLSLSLAEIEALSAVDETRTFQCVTGWVVPHVPWHGVRLSRLLALGRIRPQATDLSFASFDGVYTESLTLAQAMAHDVLVATGMYGSPLPRAQGAPVRLVVPGMFGYKSIKWLGRITAVTRQTPGYWEQRGYPVDATIPAPGQLFGPLLRGLH